ncbi:hypothetical protein GGR51DRAFT_500799 [Nemania sp. FL0031]|nr:hypothetical protein GGR51DRAFT_500799 [Nemania sp. FL0031]
MLSERVTKPRISLQQSCTWPTISRWHQNNVVSYQHHHVQAPSHRKIPHRAAFITIAFIAKCHRKRLGNSHDREHIGTRPPASPLLLLLAALFSISATRGQNPTSYYPGSAEIPRQIHVSNMNVQISMDLVVILPLLMLLWRWSPASIVNNITNQSGVGNEAYQRGFSGP